MTFSTVNVFAGGNASSNVSPSYVATVELSSDAFKIIFRVDCRCSINDGHPRLSIATSTDPGIRRMHLRLHTLGGRGSAATVGGSLGATIALLAASRLRCSGSPLRDPPPSAVATSDAASSGTVDGGRCVGKRRP